MFAKAAVLGAAVIVAEAAALHAVVSGAGRWVREGDGAAVTRAARVAARAVVQDARERLGDAMLESARFAARSGAPTGAFALARSLRRHAAPAGLPGERVVIVRAECVAGAKDCALRARALREAVRKIEAFEASI